MIFFKNEKWVYLPMDKKLEAKSQQKVESANDGWQLQANAETYAQEWANKW